MTYNIGDLNGRRPELEDVVRIIIDEGIPDLLLLQEVAGEKQAFTLADSLGMPHYVYSNNKGRSYGPAMQSSTDYLTGTYKKSSLPVEPRIDFIFHSGNIRCREASVARDSAGDHYPVRAVLEWSS